MGGWEGREGNLLGQIRRAQLVFSAKLVRNFASVSAWLAESKSIPKPPVLPCTKRRLFASVSKNFDLLVKFRAVLLNFMTVENSTPRLIFYDS